MTVSEIHSDAIPMMKPSYHKRRKLTDPREDTRRRIDPTLRFSDIAGYIIDLYCCRCDRHSETTATALMSKAGGAAFVAAVLKNARCTECGYKGEPEIRLRAGPKASPFDQRDTID